MVVMAELGANAIRRLGDAWKVSRSWVVAATDSADPKIAEDAASDLFHIDAIFDAHFPNLDGE